MRSLLLVLALAGCKDKTTPAAPKVGSTATTPDALARPPTKSAPLDAAKALELAKLDVDGWTKDARLANASGLEVRFAKPPLAITVQASKCFDCLPMEEAKWRAKSDALRGLIASELRDHKDTVWELGMTDLAGTSAAYTFHIGHVPAAYATAYSLYFNDGINMIRVVAEYGGDVPASREAMTSAAPKATLEQTAKAFADRFVHAW